LSFQTLLSIHLSFVLRVSFVPGFVRTVRIFFSFFSNRWKWAAQKQLMGVSFFRKEGRKESPCRYCSSKNNDKDTHVSSPGQQTHTHTPTTQKRHIHTRR
jgi:hypothetical protein